MNKTVYDIITEKIIERLQAGEIPWRKTWSGGSLPRNLVTKRQYNGINLLLLYSAGYRSGYWLTFNQTKAAGGSVKPGEHGMPVIFWKLWEPKTRQFITRESGETEEKPGKDKAAAIPVLRYYTVFNVEQTTLPVPDAITRPVEPIPACEAIVGGYTTAPPIEHKEQRAYYAPGRDVVNMPKQATFTSDAEYYAALFHELTHSTGAKNRLDRFGDTPDQFQFGSASYSKEELVAELGAAFLCADAGIDNVVQENQTAYIQNWIKALKNDVKLIVIASAKAQKSTRYILGEPVTV